MLVGVDNADYGKYVMTDINTRHLWKTRVVSNPDILAGKPSISGTRISVELLLDCLASGWGVEEIIESYPNITQEDVTAALAFAADVLGRRPFVTVDEIDEGSST